ncbi:hypothetical protein HKI87_15g80290 [Chloropicon roscoffensis]|uniref:Uncharacterized protein n=1 Tax=Chloropicon roscoffensis TaxID=1461544 RepID=A0AAX4PJS6_9CHLO
MASITTSVGVRGRSAAGGRRVAARASGRPRLEASASERVHPEAGRNRRAVLGALAVSIVGFKVMSAPEAALAFGPFGGGNKNAKDAANPYADMMKKSGREAPSAEKLYESGGGACGNGYELKVEKVLGSSCVCADEAVCGEGAEGERKDISLYERSFGKDE